jgi:hypothetical protein
MDSTHTLKTGKRPHRVNVRFSNEEYGHLWEQCRIVRQSPAGLLRSLAAGARLRPVTRFPDDVQRAIKSLGGNLNQLAHQANMGRVDKSEVESLREGIARLLVAIGAR